MKEDFHTLGHTYLIVGTVRLGGAAYLALRLPYDEK